MLRALATLWAIARGWFAAVLCIHIRRELSHRVFFLFTAVQKVYLAWMLLSSREKQKPFLNTCINISLTSTFFICTYESRVESTYTFVTL